MAYKVLRQELVQRRPDWLVFFLFRVSPAVYNIHDTYAAAQDSLQSIKSVLETSRLLDKKSRLRLYSDGDTLEIKSNKDRTFIRFQIDRNYSSRAV